MAVFRVVRRNGSVDLWGVEQEADFEIRRDGTLRVVVYESLPNGLRHATDAMVYQERDWTDVRSSSPPMHPGRSRGLGSQDGS